MNKAISNLDFVCSTDTLSSDLESRVTKARSVFKSVVYDFETLKLINGDTKKYISKQQFLTDEFRDNVCPLLDEIKQLKHNELVLKDRVNDNERIGGEMIKALKEEIDAYKQKVSKLEASF